MGVMLFPSLWLENASGRGGGGGGGGGACFAPHSLLSFRLPPHLLYLSSSLFFSSFFLAPLPSHLLLLLSLSFVPIFFLFSFFLSSFHYVFLFCLPSPSFFFFFKSTTFSSIPIFFPLFFLRELLVLCALRELLVLYAFYDVIEDTIDCNQP